MALFAWSKSTRIIVMLAIDIVFFLVELISGFIIDSLALKADAFHMLNDIISLFVGLWAVSAAKRATTDRFSYGWLRAEILGANINAVFLIALCCSIVIDAVGRFMKPPEIKQPEVMAIVGACGLVSNLLGFFVLGGHGHSHGPGDGHSHGEGHSHPHTGSDVRAAEEGRADVLDENGPVVDILPTTTVNKYAQPLQTPPSRQVAFDHQIHRKFSSPNRHSRLASIDDMAIHPASFRQDIIDASRATQEDESTSESGADEEAAIEGTESREDSPLLKKDNNGKDAGKTYGTRSHAKRPRRSSEIHRGHNHTHPKKAGSGGGHGHSHGDMGMNAMVLHVIGDALGNVGVIITALIVWMTEWKYKDYADPAVSLFIALIILRSALPLTFATSKILLQSTPENIEIGHIKADIEELDNVESCHHVHVWQLSDSQIVASLHILVKFPMSDTYAEQYMQLAREVRKCLHGYGIHSATIQPEFCLDMTHVHGREAPVDSVDGPADSLTATCGVSEQEECLMDCVDGCVEQGCCKPAGSRPGSSRSRTSSHNHDHDHDHDHGHSHH
ncbi:Zinc/cadmium resistance protein [Rhypophila decipiens]